ncbi:MAG TPA: pitrilysin family protein [Candidatus Acidoferrum sp.]|jgi:zinc protease|nr:pitrilysin family protein [Candidatus Acidoferrum sp.]
MDRISFLAGVALISTLTLSLAAEPPRKVASVEGITEYQLDNGLRVLVFPDRSQSKVTVNMTVLVGSRQEGYGETGMAHLLEHMVFKGTPRHPAVPKALQEHGAQFNGSTSSDRVNYFETMTASDENLAFGLDLESDRLVNSYIKRADLESEMTVVRNEFERGENSPAGVLGKRVAAAAYNWHNYGKPTIGNRSDIERVPIERLQAFYKKYYQPDNVVLVVAGRFDEAKALELVQKYFGPIPRPTRTLETTYTEEPAQDGERTVTLRRVGDVGAIEVAYHIPAGPNEDWPALQVLANILSTQPSGRLYKSLVETKKAINVFSYASGEHDPGLMEVGAEVQPDKLDEVRDLLISDVEHLASKPVTDQEVNRAKQQLLKAREMAATDTSRIAVSLSEWAAQGDWRLYFLHRDRLEQVTPAQVQTVAARYLQRNNHTVGIFIPTEKPERIDIPPTPDIPALVSTYKGRAAIIEGEVFDATPQNVEARVQRLELPEAIKVTLLPKKSRGEEVHLTLALHYGNEENLKGLESAAGFLPDLMLRGAKKLPYQQMRDELDRLKATISAGGGGGGGRRGRGGPPAGGALGAVSFSVQAKRDTLPAVLEILRQVLREPALPSEEFDVLKRARVASIEQMRTEPGALGPRLLQQELNPHPKGDVRYVPGVDESLERLKSVTYAQVAQLYREYLGSQSGELTIVGDFDQEACLPILKAALAGWEAARPYARIAMPITREVAGSQRQLNTPDKANATYAAGVLFPLRDDAPDYPAILIGNYIFGSGALSSRLGDRIRQKEGLSYGVSSSLSVSPFDQRAVLTVTAICNPRNIGRLETAAREELDRLVRDGVTQDELDQARRGYLEARIVARSSDPALAGLLNSLRHENRTLEFEAALEKNIRALTPDQVSTAWRTHIDAKKLVVVTAGDFESKPTPVPARTE